MHKTTLGGAKLNVSRLCYGTLTLGPLQANLPLQEGAGLLAYAIGQGINFFDTAQLYQTYPYIAEAIRRTKRYDIVVATKTYAYTKQLAKEAVEQARRELNRDYIDIFMLHEQESLHTLNGHGEALDYLYSCKARGIIRAVGASMHHIAAVYGAIEKKLDVIHPLINVRGLGIVDGSREEMEAAVTAAHKQGIGVYGMKVFGGGNLFKRAEECLQYALGQQFLDAIAVGMQSVDEINANIHFFNEGVFSPEESRKLAEKTRRLHIDEWCEGCGACADKCPQQALAVKDGSAVCAHEKCLLCGYCAAHCPAWAIKVV